MKLNFTIENQTLLSSPDTDKLNLVSDSRNYLVAHFDFLSDEWKDTIVYALFSYGKETYKMIVGADKNLEWNECYVPAEVIKAPGFTMSCYAGGRIPTNPVQIKIKKSGYTDKITNQKTTPDIMDQMNDYMMKYAMVCNEILKECQKVRDEIGGNK